tara:strand:- start:1016 stop:1207 length:192 start_codon:yes stop_codon:yes gene_type:complete
MEYSTIKGSKFQMDFEKNKLVLIILFFIKTMMTCIWFFEKQQNNYNNLMELLIGFAFLCWYRN